MTANLLEQLKTIDPAVLTEVVRKDQRDPDLVISDWKVEKLAGGFASVFRLRGLLGVREWAVVAKFCNSSEQGSEKPDGWSYWQREILAFQSGEMECLPSGIRAPRYYGVTHSEDGVWLWIENIRDVAPKTWTLDIFQCAARQLGHFHGAYLGGHPVPAQPWFSSPWFRSVWADGEWLSESMNPEAEGSFWKSPILQEMFAPKQKARILQLITEKKAFFDASDRLPQVLCHNDAQRRNILWTDRFYEKEPTVIDWAFSGPGALGSDLCQLIGTSMWFYEYSPFEAETLEKNVLESYLTGIADQKVEVDRRLVRLGYLISLAIWLGATMPALVYLQLPPEAEGEVPLFGRKKGDLIPGWMHLNAFALDRTDEARSLIKQLVF
jgi:hypothetical protein